MGFEFEELNDLERALSKLQNESGKLAKQDILKEFVDLKYFKDTLHFLYNNMIVTGISKAKLRDPRGMRPTEGFVLLESYDELLTYLKSNNTGRLVDLSTVNGMITNYGGEILTMLKGIVTKDIPLGISASTLNKVYGKDFVPKFDVMKGVKFDPEKHMKNGRLSEIHAITDKIDGNRCVVLIDYKGNVTMMARSGKPYEGYKELEDEINKLNLRGVVFDGELLAKNPDGVASDELFKITQSITRKKGDKIGLEYWIYDTLPYKEFFDGKSKMTYEARRESLDLLEELFRQTKALLLHIVPVAAWTQNMDIVQKFIEFADVENKEGIMLNAASGLYTTSRTKQLLKVKTFHTVDLRCTGVLEETRGGKLGAIEVDYKGHTVKVGSGFTDFERESFWMHPDSIVGKIVEVGYFEESKNKDGDISLRFPTFKLVRTDKDETSYN